MGGPQWAPPPTPHPLSGLSFLIWKGWEAGSFWRPFACSVPKIWRSFGVSLLPSPQAALLGPVQLALAGCQSPGAGDQLVRAEALERVAPGAGAAGKVTPLTSPAAGKRVAGGMALPPRGTAQPTHFWAGAWDSQGSGTAQWEGSSLALSGFHCPSWLTARLTQLLGKGPCSLPQALHSGPPAAHPGKRAQWDPCLAPSPPRSPGLSLEPRWGQGPASPPIVFSAGFPSTRPGQRSWGRLPGHRASTLTTRPGTRLGLVERCF